MVSKELLDILVCPKCKGSLEQGKNFLVCNNCRLKYEILEGEIPDMLVENAKKI